MNFMCSNPPPYFPLGSNLGRSSPRSIAAFGSSEDIASAFQFPLYERNNKLSNYHRSGTIAPVQNAYLTDEMPTIMSPSYKNKRSAVHITPEEYNTYSTKLVGYYSYPYNKHFLNSMSYFSSPTNLHKAILADAPLETLKFLIDMGCKTDERVNLFEDYFEETTSTARNKKMKKTQQQCFASLHKSSHFDTLLITDEHNMSPLDHLISAVLLGTSSHAIDALEYLLMCCPEAAIATNNNKGKNPLFRLLGTASVGGDTRITRISKATKLIVAVCPELAGITSPLYGLTPIHLALMFFGNKSIDIIQTLIRANPQSVGVPSLSGDLPIHTAMAYGVSMETLEVILSATASLSPDLLSSTDRRGLSPIQLAWIKYVDPDFEYRLRQIRKLEIYGPLLDEAVQDVFHQLLPSMTTVSNESSYDTQRRCIASVFGTFWQRTELYLKYVQTTSSKWNIIHAASAANIPRAVLKLVLLLHPDDVSKADGNCQLPLHIAASTPKQPWWDNGADSLDERPSLVQLLLEINPSAASFIDNRMQLPLHRAVERATRGGAAISLDSDVKRIVEAYPEALQVKDPNSGLYPFMQAAIGDHASLATVYFLLRESPHVVSAGLSSK